MDFEELDSYKFIYILLSRILMGAAFLLSPHLFFSPLLRMNGVGAGGL